MKTSESKTTLIELFEKHNIDTIYSIIRHVSASGMSRRIDFYCIIDNQPRYLTGYIADILGYKVSNKGGINVQGCGMDMCFDTVYRLSCNLYCSDKYEHDKAYKLNSRII